MTLTSQRLRGWLVQLALGAAVLAVSTPAPLAAQASATDSLQAAPSTAAQIIAAAPAADWVTIAPEDLLVMTLAPDAQGQARQVIFQLMPAPFSQGWIGNIRKLAAAHWWDGMAITRVQDNFVAQFGDPDGDTPKAKPLPQGLAKVGESEYLVGGLPQSKPPALKGEIVMPSEAFRKATEKSLADLANGEGPKTDAVLPYELAGNLVRGDAYAPRTGFYQGFPIAASARGLWPTHCYATLGVGRNERPDTGSGAELYVAIGTPPRQLDRNLAVVGRVIAGMEHLSSLPRGPAPMGIYASRAEQTPILWIRLASALPASQQPRYQYLATSSASFAAYVLARVNRRDAFYAYAAGSADICNLPVPLRSIP